ncbi:MAG: glycosyltransferase, partial [Candidatus Odinarchaeia archaeon]
MKMSLKIFVRKLLGRKLTFKLRNFVSEVAFRLKAVPPATSIKREDGISAMMCTMNEEDWVEPSMLSIKDLVDEYIVIDSSTDRTPEIISRVAMEHGLKLKMKRIKSGDLVTARNLALRLSEFKWILHWDADFIAKEELSEYLRTLISELDPNRYYLVYWPHICLDGDLFHQNPNMRLHIEHWLFTYSPSLKYVQLNYHDSLIAPLTHYKVIYISKPLSFHLRTVRSPSRLLYKYLWYKMRKEGLEGVFSLDEYVKIKIKELYGTPDINEAAKIHLKQFIQSLDKYDKKTFGDYPKILKEYVKKTHG